MLRLVSGSSRVRSRSAPRWRRRSSRGSRSPRAAPRSSSRRKSQKTNSVVGSRARSTGASVPTSRGEAKGPGSNGSGASAGRRGRRGVVGVAGLSKKPSSTGASAGGGGAEDAIFCAARVGPPLGGGPTRVAGAGWRALLRGTPSVAFARDAGDPASPSRTDRSFPEPAVALDGSVPAAAASLRTRPLRPGGKSTTRTLLRPWGTTDSAASRRRWSGSRNAALRASRSWVLVRSRL